MKWFLVVIAASLTLYPAIAYAMCFAVGLQTPATPQGLKQAGRCNRSRGHRLCVCRPSNLANANRLIGI